MFGAIDASVARQLARIEKKRADGERAARIKRVVGQEVHDMARLRAAQSGERNMRRVALAIRAESDALQRRFDLALKMHQRLVLPHPRPKRARPLAAEFADP